jgi:hypothetical protein
MERKVLLFGLVLLGACGEEPSEFASAAPDAGARLYCAVNCVHVDVQGSYTVSEASGRVTVKQGTTTLFSYDIEGANDDFGSWAASGWELVDCHEDLIATYGLGAGLTATTSGSGTLIVSSGSSQIIRVETQNYELHEEQLPPAS